METWSDPSQQMHFLTPVSVLDSFSTALKTLIKNSLGKKWFIWLTIPHHNPLHGFSVTNSDQSMNVDDN